MTLPDCKHLLLEFDAGVLSITINRSQVKNALSLETVNEIIAAFGAVRGDLNCRIILLQGAEGNFCAGADIRDLAAARNTKTSDGSDPIAALNRKFGEMLIAANAAPQAVVVLLEGAILGGGFGLACVSDIAIARADAKFGLPETGLGIPPAQIAPFVVQRIGITQARRLGVSGPRFNGQVALDLGLVHFVEADAEAMQNRLEQVCKDIRRCAPQANAMTKEIMLRVTPPVTDEQLDQAAAAFSQAVTGPEGSEGTQAFLAKRKPSWAQD